METTPFFILGTMFGVIATLLIQYCGRRRVRQALTGAAPDPDRAVMLLSAENERQHGLILRLEERISVMERIATDPAERIRRDIENLRLSAD